MSGGSVFVPAEGQRVESVELHAARDPWSIVSAVCLIIITLILLAGAVGLVP